MNTELLLAELPRWGPWLVGTTTFLSCLLVPVPSSLMMLAAAALSITGELSMVSLWLAALAGAILGDATGYFLSERLLARLAGSPRAEPLMTRAKRLLVRRGRSAIFLTRWLFSPLGPWTNLAAGATRYGFARFMPAAIAGEVVWVSVYLGLGRAFGSSYQIVADVMGSMIGLLAGLGVMAILGRHLWKRRGRISI